ncbi:Cct domain [Globisporangium polare]
MELPERNATDAEKLLMSFDTMNFTIPSPTSSSSKHKRASLFARKDPGKGGAPARSSSGGAASTGSMSPSLKLKVSARALTPEELLEEQAAAGKASLSGSSSTDPFLGVLSITAPTSEQLLGGENAKKIGSYSPAARKLRIQKFHEKRKNRTWKKSIKYDCRKKLADDRPRIKGRFVRVLENMCDMKDDEPMSPMGDMSPASISSFTPPVTPMSSPEPASAPFSPAMMSPMAPAVATAMPLVATPAPAPTQVPTAALALPPSASVSALSASTAAIASLVASTS